MRLYSVAEYFDPSIYNYPVNNHSGSTFKMFVGQITLALRKKNKDIRIPKFGYKVKYISSTIRIQYIQ